MDLHTILKQGITFGPFKTAHHQSIVNAEFRAAFLRQIAEAIVPNLTIGTDRVKGTVNTAYDDEKYFGPNSAVKFRYSFRGTFFQGRRKETVDLGFEYEPMPSGFRLVFVEPRIMTARSFEKHAEDQAAILRRLDLDAAALVVPGKSLAEHWEACTRLWTRGAFLLEDIVGPMGRRSLEFHVCERLARANPGSESFLLEKMLDPSPLLAAYAFTCWTLLRKPDRTRVPAAGFLRKEALQVRSGCSLDTVALGKWMADFFQEGTAPPELPEPPPRRR